MAHLFRLNHGRFIAYWLFCVITCFGVSALAETPSFTTLTNLEGLTQRVFVLAFNHKGTLLAGGDLGGTACLWKVSDGKLLYSMPHSAGLITSVAFSPDDSLLAIGSYEKVAEVWEVATGKLVARIEHPMPVGGVLFLPEGKTLLTRTDNTAKPLDTTIRLWGIESGELTSVFQKHTSSVLGFALSTNGSVLVSGGGDKFLVFWDMHSGKVLKKRKMLFAVGVLALDSKDSQVACTGGLKGDIALLHTDGRYWGTLKGHKATVRQLCFSPDGSMLASGSFDGTVRVWDIETKKTVHTFPADSRLGTHCLAFSPDGKMLAYGTEPCVLKVWDVASESLVHIIDDTAGSVHSLAFSPDGKMLAYGDDTGAVGLCAIPSSTDAVARLSR